MTTPDFQDATAFGGRMNPPANPSLVSAPLRHRYELRDELLRGGCGVIYRAWDRQLEREVVIKKAIRHASQDPLVQERFLNEAKITGLLQHPGIVPVHELGTDDRDGDLFYVMKWLRGQTLSTALEQFHRKPPRVKSIKQLRPWLERFQSVCQTIAYAHERGYIHRDLKPANILIGDFGETIVLDWGLAKSLRAITEEKPDRHRHDASMFDTKANSQTSNQTLDGSILGTASYMSPEQARGEMSMMDERSDVFSLGIILYEMITGVSPFRCSTIEETLDHIARVDFVRIRTICPKVPKALASIIETCLKPLPEDRYASALQLEADIGRFLTGESVSTYAEPWWAMLDRVASNHRTLVWSSLLATTAIGLVSLLALSLISSAHSDEKAARKLAEREHSAKTRALQSEQVAHHEALAQLEEAQEAVNGWLLDLGDCLRSFPGLQTIRRQILHQGAEHYEKLLATQSSSEFVKLQKAKAANRLGDIYRELSQSGRALDCYRSALENLTSVHTEDRDWLALAQLHQAHATIAMARIQNTENQGWKSDPNGDIDKIIQQLEQVEPASPVFSESIRMLVRARSCMASLERSQGHYKEARTILHQAIHLLDLHGDHSPHSHDQTIWMQLFSELGSLCMGMHEYQESIRAYQRLLQIQSERIEHIADRPDWLEQRAQTRLHLASCLSRVYRNTEAITQFEAAEEDLARYSMLTDNQWTTHDQLATLRSRLGSVYLASGDAPKALEAIESSLESLDVVSQNPDALHQAMERRAMTQLLKAESLLHQSPQASLQLLQSLKWAEREHIMLDAFLPLPAWEWKEAIAIQSLVGCGRNEEAASRWEAWSRRELRSDRSRESQEIERYLRTCSLLAVAKAHAAKDQADLATSCREEALDDLDQLQGSTFSTVALAAQLRWLEDWVQQENPSVSSLQRAYKTAETLVQDHPTLPPARYWLAWVQYRKRDYPSAIATLLKAKRLRRTPALQDTLFECLLQLQMGQAKEVGTVRGSTAVSTDSHEDLQSLLRHTFPHGSHEEWLQRQVRMELDSDDLGHSASDETRFTNEFAQPLGDSR